MSSYVQAGPELELHIPSYNAITFSLLNIQ